MCVRACGVACVFVLYTRLAKSSNQDGGLWRTLCETSIYSRPATHTTGWQIQIIRMYAFLYVNVSKRGHNDRKRRRVVLLIILLPTQQVGISLSRFSLVLLNDRSRFTLKTPISLLPSQVSHSLISLYVLSTLIPRIGGQPPRAKTHEYLQDQSEYVLNVLEHTTIHSRSSYLQHSDGFCVSKSLSLKFLPLPTILSFSCILFQGSQRVSSWA